MFDEVIEGHGEDEAEDPGVVVGDVDDPGDGHTDGDHQPVERRLRQLFLDRVEQTLVGVAPAQRHRVRPCRHLH